MKRNGRNSDCKGEVTSFNTLRICVSNPYYALLSMLQAMKAEQASQPVFGISLTTILPAHNVFNHWHDEHIE